VHHENVALECERGDSRKFVWKLQQLKYSLIPLNSMRSGMSSSEGEAKLPLRANVCLLDRVLFFSSAIDASRHPELIVHFPSIQARYGIVNLRVWNSG
jgi:hypothetical protein